MAQVVVVCRKVALSEGRVHDGTLECAYHGWEFNGSGKLVVIPQASSPVSVTQDVQHHETFALVM